METARKRCPLHPSVCKTKRKYKFRMFYSEKIREVSAPAARAPEFSPLAASFRYHLGDARGAGIALTLPRRASFRRSPLLPSAAACLPHYDSTPPALSQGLSPCPYTMFATEQQESGEAISTGCLVAPDGGRCGPLPWIHTDETTTDCAVGTHEVSLQ